MINSPGSGVKASDAEVRPQNAMVNRPPRETEAAAMEPPSPHLPARTLSLGDATSIIVGTIIGAAIFHIPQWVAGQVDSPAQFLGIWLFGGFLACCGALCFAELTTAYNEDGGEYVYIREACGRYMSFQYAWVTGWILRPANMAAMAITFALFGSEAADGLQWLGVFLFASLGVSLLAVLNLCGVRVGQWSQNLLTLCKVAGLLLVCLIGSLPSPAGKVAADATTTRTGTSKVDLTPARMTSVEMPPVDETQAGEKQKSDTPAGKTANGQTVPSETQPGETGPAATSPEQTAVLGEEPPQPAPPAAPREWSVAVSGLLMALVFVMYSFGGWNDISFVAGEVRDPNRNLPRALFLGLAIVTLVYLYVNWVLVANLGLSGLQQAKNAPAEMLQRQLDAQGWGAWNPWIRGLLGLLVGISCLGAVNAMLITSPRIYYAAGQQHHWFQRFARWNSDTQIPRAAIIAQWLATLLLLAACSGLTGPLGRWLSLESRIFQRSNPFDELVAVSAPFFWGFLTLVVLGQMLLRVTDPDRPRPVKTWAYPLPNLIFATASAFMLYRSIEYAWSQQYFVSGGIVLAVFLLGLILGLFSNQPNTPTVPTAA